ncbi:hypothetical protein L5515_019041 [Caenorhabditis briggsae]|uniref:Uncharacterized protein n=1 Tax=Caenorhabditis briggsae TaxID=6238 RepID=A0AAE9FNJ1_CAEBR|nr:hypothetical protein L5515_019041 [Caenorhabditis briggsae]
MSVNRVAVVMKPMNMWFSNTRVFIFCGLIAILMLISLLIPYFSPCDINFDMTRLAFISGCAPGRHPALYVGLSPAGKLLYFYVRMEAVAFMNFLIYFVESKKTRIMVCRYLKIGTKPGSNLITVSQHRTVSGSTGNVATVTN